MEATIVNHQNIGQKYRVVIERAASTKGVLGWKIEANSDCIDDVLRDIDSLKASVEAMTPVAPEPEPVKRNGA